MLPVKELLVVLALIAGGWAFVRIVAVYWFFAYAEVAAMPELVWERGIDPKFYGYRHKDGVIRDRPE